MPYRRRRSYRTATRLYRRPRKQPARPRAGLAAVALAAALTTALMLTLGPHARGTLSAAATTASTANANCDIIVPAHPLSAAGLATPYRLTGPHGRTPAASGCTEANAASLGAFVQATILDPASGALTVYEPLVITEGTRPAVAPVKPRLPRDAIVTIDFGFNGTSLRQTGATPHALRDGHCVDGLRGSLFGQVSFCNGPAFFRAAYKDLARGALLVPAAGFSRTGQSCPTTRSFRIVDQDPSDNVTTRYLLTRSGRTAQFSRRNDAALPRAARISNGSDNALLDDFVDPALGCRPFEVPDLSMGGAKGTSQALDELSAAANQAAPRALVPENDEMVLMRGGFSVAKTNLYRSNVGQPAISPVNNQAASPKKYCQNMMAIQPPFLFHNEARLARAPSPVPADGSNLFTFMASRLVTSFGILGCRHYGLADPVQVARNGAGTPVSARLPSAGH